MTTPTPTITPADDTCQEAVSTALENHPAIVGARFDAASEQMAVGFDPSRLSAAEFEKLARRAAPAFHQQFETCTLRLDKQGGRSCETCALHLENRLHTMPGVVYANVSYRQGLVKVTYDQAQVQPAQITQTLAAHGARPKPAATPTEDAPLTGWAWVVRYLEAIFTVITLLGMVGGWLAEQFGNSTLGWVLFGVAYGAGGAFGLKGALEALHQRTVDIDLLMVLAAVGAWLVGAPFEGALLLFLFSLSNVLQDFALNRTRHAIRALMKLRPKEALTRRGTHTVMVPIEALTLTDVIIVRPGERIAMDGVVVAGESAVDQAPITGESIPVLKRVGQAVLAGTINQSGGLEVRVSRLAQDSTLARMIRLVEEAQSEKANTQRWIDAFEQRYALGVIIFTALVAVVPLLLGEAFDSAFYRAMTVMVAASPCALVISTPAAILSGIGNAARRGILFKGGAHLEKAADIKVIAFDKTGTLTQGKPQVTDVLPLHGNTPAEVLALAAAVEAKSEHPLAQAIVNAARAQNLPLAEARQFRATLGKGAQAEVNGAELHIGSVRYFAEARALHLAQASHDVERLQNEGKTAILLGQITPQGMAVLGVIAVADVIRPDAPAVIRDLKRVGIQRVVMLTGDNIRTAQAIAAQAGVDEVYADLLPEDKVSKVKELKEKYGAVAMVGDGVNDAPALATATLGVAMGAAGTDVALETADLVLMSDDLSKIAYALELSRATRQTLLVNLTFAMTMIVIMIISIFTIALPLPLAVVGHEGGTVLVALYGVRLLAWNRPPRRDS